MIQTFIDYFIHLDRYLSAFIQSVGSWTYLILFLVTFGETGVVFAPMLPGDSMLFATGLLASHGDLNVVALFAVYMSAAILGYTVNYWVGRRLGVWLVEGKGSRFVKKEYLDRTHAFFEKRGAKTILIARFVPIVRTFAPFVAGVAGMDRGSFVLYNVLGGVLWVSTLVGGGYSFGNIPLIRDHFTEVVFAIIFLSLTPAFFEVARERRARKRPPAPPGQVDK